MAIYFGSYFAPSNRGIQQVSKLRGDGLLYGSVNHIAMTQGSSSHDFLSRLFVPLNLIDQALFGGPASIRCNLFIAS